MMYSFMHEAEFDTVFSPFRDQLKVAACNVVRDNPSPTLHIQLQARLKESIVELLTKKASSTELRFAEK